MPPVAFVHAAPSEHRPTSQPASRAELPPSSGSSGERGPRSFPSFAVDPAAWFDHVDQLLATDPSAVRDAEPANWVDPAGHSWRVLAATDGPEVRPGLQSPFLPRGTLPRITAVQVTPDALLVELAMRDWHEVATVDSRDVSVREVGLAMLTGVELPHEGLERVGREVWEAAERRWARGRSAGQVAITVGAREPSDPPPGAA